MADRCMTILRVRGEITRSKLDELNALTGRDLTDPQWVDAIASTDDFREELIAAGLDFVFRHGPGPEWTDGVEFWDASVDYGRAYPTVRERIALVADEVQDSREVDEARTWGRFIADLESTEDPLTVVKDGEEVELRLWSADVPVWATAYIQARSAAEARRIYLDRLAGDTLEVSEGGVVNRAPFDQIMRDPEAVATLSPAMTLATPQIGPDVAIDFAEVED